MAITYTWTIPTCEHEVATGGITVAHWRVSAVDGDYTASSYGTCGFTPDATEAALAAKIEADKNPTSASGTPWG